jgi:hypothetical protein
MLILFFLRITAFLIMKYFNYLFIYMTFMSCIKGYYNKGFTLFESSSVFRISGLCICGTDVSSTICSHGECGDIFGFLYEVVEEQKHGKLGFSYEIGKFGQRGNHPQGGLD